MELNEQTDPQQIHWRSFTRIAFRFVFCYLALYCLYIFAEDQQFFRLLVSGRFSDSFIDPLLHRVVPWVGKHILHLSTDITIFTNGSADTTYDYVLIVCELFLAAVATVVWSLLDRKRPNYRVLHEWLRFVVRLALAMQLFFYGMDKLIPVQFGSLTLARISQRVGNLSPQDMLWIFMAASKPYTIFSGFAEVLAGVLLLVPQLTTLGALITIGVMANVFTLDMSYDVPVKLGSLHYLLMAMFLVAPEAQRLMNVFILNRPAAPSVSVPLSSRRWINRGALILSALVGIVCLPVLTHFSLQEYARHNPPRTQRSPLYGVWVVDEFSVSGNGAGDAAPGNSSQSFLTPKLAAEMNVAPGQDRWTEMIFEMRASAVVLLGNDVLDSVTLALDPQKQTATIGDDTDPAWRCDFVYQRSGSQLGLQGSINGNPVTLKLHRLDDSKMVLTTRGFHWINEHPF